MKKLLSVVGALTAVLVFATVATATTTNTIHLSGVPIDVGPAGCVPGDLVISGNGVLHETINNAGDVWVTGTVEGSATASDPSSGFSGHATAWFGLENNAMNSVQHFTADSIGTLANGTALAIHEEGQFTMNAQGVPVVTRVTVTCR